MFFFPKAMTAIYALTQINQVQSQDLSISQISTRDSDGLRQVLDYGCNPVTDFALIRARVREFLSQPFLLRKDKSGVINQLLEILPQTREMLTQRTDRSALANNLVILQEISESNNITQILPELNDFVSQTQLRASLAISLDHIEERVYQQLPNQETEQLLQFALRKLDIACQTKESINLAYHSYCHAYFWWGKAILETAYQELPQSSTFRETELLKLIIQMHISHLTAAYEQCNIDISPELRKSLDKISQETNQDNISPELRKYISDDTSYASTQEL